MFCAFLPSISMDTIASGGTNVENCGVTSRTHAVDNREYHNMLWRDVGHCYLCVVRLAGMHRK